MAETQHLLAIAPVPPGGRDYSDVPHDYELANGPRSEFVLCSKVSVVLISFSALLAVVSAVAFRDGLSSPGGLALFIVAMCFGGTMALLWLVTLCIFCCRKELYVDKLDALRNRADFAFLLPAERVRAFAQAEFGSPGGRQLQNEMSWAKVAIMSPIAGLLVTLMMYIRLGDKLPIGLTVLITIPSCFVLFVLLKLGKRFLVRRQFNAMMASPEAFPAFIDKDSVYFGRLVWFRESMYKAPKVTAVAVIEFDDGPCACYDYFTKTRTRHGTQTVRRTLRVPLPRSLARDVEAFLSAHYSVFLRARNVVAANYDAAGDHSASPDPGDGSVQVEVEYV